MKKPLIALTLDYETTKGYSKYPWYAIRENYFTSIEESGGIAIGIPHNIKDIKIAQHKWKFKHPQPSDLKELFVSETGKDLAWFFERWYYYLRVVCPICF